MVILGKYIGSNKEANLFPLDETTIPVITGLASGSVSDTDFSVSALLSPGGLPTTWSVEYGLSAAYGTTLAGGTSTEEATISKALTGLQQNTLYYFRIKAVNDKGTAYSEGLSVLTNVTTYVPVFSALSSGTITDVGATVAGTVDNGYLSTVWSIEYGLTTGYGSTAIGGTITTPTAVNKALTGLLQNTLYHWRIKAVNSKGTAYSSDQTLTTTNISWKIPVTANTSGSLGTGVIVVSATEDFTPSTTGGVTISSTVRAADSTYRRHTITFTCALNQNGEITIPDGTKIISCGSFALYSNVNFYAPSIYAPKVTFNYSNLPNLLKIYQCYGNATKLVIPANNALPSTLQYLEIKHENWTYTGALPSSLTVLDLANNTPNGLSGTINWTYNGALPSGLTRLSLDGANIDWSYSGPLPVGLTSVILKKDKIFWTYTGALPVNLSTLSLAGTNINWTYSGALPTSLMSLNLTGENLRWTYTGALPSNLMALTLNGNNINWTYNGALPSSQLNGVYLIGSNIRWTYSGGFPSWCSQIYLDGSNINYTGTDLNNNPTLYTFSLLNYRTTKMSSSTLSSMLYTLLYRDGALPATITINDYIDYASPPQYILDIVAQIKTTRSVTTVNLGE